MESQRLLGEVETHSVFLYTEYEGFTSTLAWPVCCTAQQLRPLAVEGGCVFSLLWMACCIHQNSFRYAAVKKKKMT